MRPRTLPEVARLAQKGDGFDRCVANFLDEFYAAPNAEALRETPALLAPQFGGVGRVQDAYLAATAEELARQFNLPLPRWADHDSRKLRRPWFASPLASLRTVLLLEGPPVFGRGISLSAKTL